MLEAASFFFPLESVLRLMEGVAGQEGYCYEDLTAEGCGLERVGNNGGEDWDGM